jgi:dTDP-4-amino-4,6-dideoxygalactose transaminase
MSKDILLYKSYSDDKDIEAVNKVIKRGTWWIKGKEIIEFEEQLAKYIGTNYAITFNSGTSGLLATLLANNVKDGEVIIPSFTFIATADAVVNACAKPVFADIEKETYGLSAESVRKQINERTKAIIAVHYLGDICNDITELKEISDEKGIPLIEDAAHAIGASSYQKNAGTFGDVAMFSFSFNKVITTGEGGAVVTDSDDINTKLRLIRSHGQTQTKDVILPGYNLRMSTMTAALGLSQLDKLDMLIEKRIKMAGYYTKSLKHYPVICPHPKTENRCVYQRYSILLNNKTTRDTLKSALAKSNIPCAGGYNPIHLFSYFKKHYGYKKGDFPVTEDISNRILTLPFHVELKTNQLDKIISVIKENI